MEQHVLDDDRVLVSLVEGYRERRGVKERMRSLSEYEIARRVGLITGSYVEYAESEERGILRGALSRLEARGLIRSAAVSGRFDTFEPAGPAARETWIPVADAKAPALGDAFPSTLEAKLDEIIRLLRSIDKQTSTRV